jgi:hypothetical protein
LTEGAGMDAVMTDTLDASPKLEIKTLRMDVDIFYFESRSDKDWADGFKIDASEKFSSAMLMGAGMMNFDDWCCAHSYAHRAHE